MKVGILTASLSRRGGGVSYAAGALSNALHASGVDVSLFAASASDPYWAPPPGYVTTLPALGPAAFGFVPGLRDAMAAADVDVLHAHGLWLYPSLATQHWAAAARRPYMVSAHGMLDPWALDSSRWKKRLAWLLFEHRNLRRSACLQALTTFEAAAMRRSGLANPIAVVPNGVEMPPPGAEAAAPDWLPRDGRQVLLFLGRMHPKKGLKQLVAAWERLKRRHPRLLDRWLLAIAGWDDGKRGHELEHAVRRSSLEHDIHFPGPLFGADKDAALRYARAFILPSYSEGLPVAVLEAWAYGLPVFMTRACNLADAFSIGAAFEITTDPDDIADRLAEILGDATALSMAGERGKALVKERFTWDRIAEQMIAVYQWLMGAGPRPATVL